MGEDNGRSKAVFTSELGYLCVLLVLFSRGVNVGCLTKDDANGPIYLMVGEVKILHMLVDEVGQGKLLNGLEVSVWGAFLDTADEGNCVSDGVFDVLQL